MNLSPSDFIILSVGELNKNKNHEIIIKALALLNDSNIHYIICGKVDQLKELKLLAKENHMEKQVHFMGYRKDIAEIYEQADIFAFPSIREGLGLAALEAMYVGLALITSNVRGPVDYMENGKTGYMCDPYDAAGFAKGILKLCQNNRKRYQMAEYNKKAVQPYCLPSVQTEVFEILQKLQMGKG